jgi:hypothetical protein
VIERHSGFFFAPKKAPFFIFPSKILKNLGKTTVFDAQRTIINAFFD